MTLYFKNGEYTEKDKLSISIDDRGYYFGDGVYEVIKVYGGKLYTAEEHFGRFLSSAQKIRMPLPYTVEEFIGIAEELVRANGISEGHVYLQATRGVAPRIHNFPGDEVLPMITAYAIDNPQPLGKLEMGVAVRTADDIRWLRCDIKSLNLLANVMAKQEAVEAGCGEAVFVRDGIVTEGSSSNIFGVKDGILYTHPATNLILNGITRRVVLKCCAAESIGVMEEPYTLEELRGMDEVFLTSTTSEITPIISIDGETVGDGTPGPVTSRLQRVFEKTIQQAMQETN
ncbi:D-alanine aminotransferase [Sporosarcina sp. NCCP-2716]|uniref:D-amino-acid transaminase n=1 Tax=Sporosarcina sp. NCCP-2716 TaxID=2943679 RepID=UPI00203EFDCA|nr:D-amino-acid transaminase [Sporosarcina sp. NCCP-2716]GKV69532.1 D-alanine aminotransferase [Sporosarcina sp. NCCP-2716]